MSTVVSVDGKVVPPEQAHISVFDRGFLYGDSVYEVVRTYRGVPFALEAHMKRLASSAERIAMDLTVDLEQLSEKIVTTHRASGNPESYLRIMITRGAGQMGLDPALALSQRRIIIARDVVDASPPPEVYTEGVKIALVSVRRNLRTAIDPQAKTGNYLNSVLALAEARKRGAYEAVMLDHRESVTEGASSNIFVVVGGVVLTPRVDVGILEGVTRAAVLEVADKVGLKVLELPLTAEVLQTADEVFITSSIREIVPVAQVDEHVIGDGSPGPVTQRIRGLFRAHVDAYVEARLNAGN